MKPKTTLPLFVLNLIMIVSLAYTLPPAETTTPPNLCGLAIKYYSGKLKIVSGEYESNSNTEITINPSTKTINVTGLSSTQDKVNFTIAIESVECNLNENCTAGQAVYHGSIKGTSTRLTLKVEARSGSLVISNSITGSNNEYLAFVTKWEIKKD